MPDGSKWGVPVEIIARHRAEHYAHEFGGDVERSLAEDTEPLFAQSEFEITDWARNNLNWSDVDAKAQEVEPPGDPDFEVGWAEGEVEIMESD